MAVEHTPRFTDVPADAWYAPYVEDGVSMGLVRGNPDGTFFPPGATEAEKLLHIRMVVIAVRQAKGVIGLWNLANTDLRRRIQAAEVFVKTPNGTGSGVLVSPTGLVISAHHVTGDRDTVDSRFPGWPEGRYAEPFMRIIKPWPEQDLVLARVWWPDMEERRAFPYLPLAARNPEAGEMLTVYGSPAGIPSWQAPAYTAREPMTLNYYRAPQVLIPLAGPVNPGNSGGMVVDAATATLAGIAVVKLLQPFEGMAFAVPRDRLVQLLTDAAQEGLIKPEEVPPA